MKVWIVFFVAAIMLTAQAQMPKKMVTSIVLPDIEDQKAYHGHLNTVLMELKEGGAIDYDLQIYEDFIDQQALYESLGTLAEEGKIDIPESILIPMMYFVVEKRGENYHYKVYYSLLELAIQENMKIKKILNIKKEGSDIHQTMHQAIQEGFDKFKEEKKEIPASQARKKLVVLMCKQRPQVPELMILNKLIEYFELTEEYDLILPKKYIQKVEEMVDKLNKSGKDSAEIKGKIATEDTTPQEILGWVMKKGLEGTLHYQVDIKVMDSARNSKIIQSIATYVNKEEEVLEKCRAIVESMYYENAMERLGYKKKASIVKSINKKKLSGERWEKILEHGDADKAWRKELAVLCLAMINESHISIETLYEKGREKGKQGIFQFLEEKGKGVYASQAIQKLGKWVGQDLKLYADLAEYYKKLSSGMKYLLLGEIVANGKSQDIWNTIASKLPEEDRQLLAAMLWEKQEGQASILEMDAKMIHWPLYEKALKVAHLKEKAKEKILSLLPDEKAMTLLLHLWKTRPGMENELSEILSKCETMPAAACKHILERYESLGESNKKNAIAMLKKIKKGQAFKLIYNKLKENENHNQQAYKELKKAFFDSEYQEKTEEIQDFAYPRPEDYNDIEEGKINDLTGPEVCRLWTIHEIKGKPIAEKALWEKAGSMVYAWYAMEGTCFPVTRPKEWQEDEWAKCWKRKYIDFTEPTWTKKDWKKQAELSAAYRKWYAEQQGLPEEKTIRKNGADFTFCLVPPGKFFMGDSENFKVLISKPYYIGKYEVTQGQWTAVMKYNPSRFKDAGNKAPVETVSWEECQEFCNKTGMNFPTEAEWEYACRSGVTYRTYQGDVDYPGSMAWYWENSERRIREVGLKDANPWGMHDMLGNVYEWCTDWKADYPADVGLGHVLDYVRLDPTGCSLRVCRGGSWSYDAQHCRSAFRFGYSPGHRYDSLGFRLRTPLTP